MKSGYTIIILLISSLSIAQNSSERHHSQTEMNCKECHTCVIPTFKNPCLTLFPDFRRDGITVHQSAAEAPEMVVIDSLADAYEPSVFTHKLHAEMASMAGGCESCHHFNPPGKVQECSSCHLPEPMVDINRPSLKGAYHRQCLNCHREWSHTTNCIVCHEKRGTEIEDKSKYLGKSHEPLVVPQKLVYETPEADGAVVTFFHNDHSQRFGLNCSDCHANESCSRCHDQTRSASRADKDVHENCVACHEPEIDDSCAVCHDEQEKTPFNHTDKGWALNRFHQDLKCDSCHRNKEFKKLDTRCQVCHKDWNKGKFDHSVTGLILDDDHADHACEECHRGSNFSVSPTCTECHDDYEYPKQKPGRNFLRQK